MALWDLVTLGWKNKKSPVIRESVRESLINITNTIAMMFFWYNWKGALVLLAEKLKCYLFYDVKYLSVNCVAVVQSTDWRKHCWFLKSEISACSGDSWLNHCHFWFPNYCVSAFFLLQQQCCSLSWPPSPLGSSGFPTLWAGELLFILFSSVFVLLQSTALAIPTSPHSGVREFYRFVSLI